MATLESELQDLFNGGNAEDGDEAGTNLAVAIEDSDIAFGQPVQINGAATLRAGTGVPASGLGANGDYFFRTDGSAGTAIYFKTGGAWSAIA